MSVKVWARRSPPTLQAGRPLLWKPDWRPLSKLRRTQQSLLGETPKSLPENLTQCGPFCFAVGGESWRVARGRAWALPDHPVPLGKTGPGAQLAGPQSACQDVWLLLLRSSTAVPHQFWRMNGSHVPTGSVPMTKNPGRGRGLKPWAHHAQSPRRCLARLRLPRAPSTFRPRPGGWAEWTAQWRPPPCISTSFVLGLPWAPPPGTLSTGHPSRGAPVFCPHEPRAAGAPTCLQPGLAHPPTTFAPWRSALAWHLLPQC